ncbi:hypothetical protein CEN50_04995 [Fischerella thermalis CCMEE 5268]|uniref:CopG family transcriptional regulator n=2 Tax=Fischerella thermalis TaxID=372787 RepID=A0A2N6L8Q7_9CYAN|nr:hypothetical protein [Fischerella thermalis]PMB00006.1 hypothetical protein CEN50_04995 [Fischerella thermalis CCMEE 5268]PMB18599.1 hypothetical protein CEN46_20675 [Fischerella thermalis CCMEE 5318]PMB38827.1 hypothetical protein CEN47_05905 [Fischerella thermalis CCMEE 5319]PMB40908.1 hypothetical protein CEN40_21340 [Fischerella thermalis CCMEE 5205]
METESVHIQVTMPGTNAPRMIRIDFSVPEALYQEALELAEAEGWKPAELHRIFWEKGFAVHAEGSNKRLVNKHLRERIKKQLEE